MKNIDDKKDISKKIKTKKEVEQKEKIVPKKKNNNKNVKKEKNEKDILQEKKSLKRNEKINKIKEEKTNKDKIKKEVLKKNENIEEIEILENFDNNNKDNEKRENTKKTKNIKDDRILETSNFKNNKKIFLPLIIIISLIFITLTTYNIITFIKYKSIVINNTPKTSKIDYLAYYKENVITLNKKILYKLEDNKLIKAGVININNYLTLEEVDFSKDGYFKIKNTSYYID